MIIKLYTDQFKIFGNLSSYKGIKIGAYKAFDKCMADAIDIWENLLVFSSFREGLGSLEIKVTIETKKVLSSVCRRLKNSAFDMLTYAGFSL